MLRHAVINEDNKVVNVIIWNGIDPWQPPQNHQSIHDPTERCDTGDIYHPETKTFIKPIIESE